MSLIIDALEKAQRDREKKKGEITEESLYRKDKRRKKKKIFLSIYIFLFFSGIGVGVGVLFFVYNQSRKNVSKTQLASGNKTTSKIQGNIRVRNVEMPKVKSVSADDPLYIRELTLPNGLYLKVDGVYMDNKIPYAMIGPYIVKKGDYIENVVKITYVDFIKVGIEYKNKKYYLLVK